MPVIITMENGQTYRLDRKLTLDNVAKFINSHRNQGALIQLETDRTPTGQMVWVDPDRVSSIIHDRYSY